MKRMVSWGLLNLLLITSLSGQTWRSSLYPKGWYPGYHDIQGRFLHDFSYAGYHAGEREIPISTSNIIDVTTAPFNADSSGANDATSAIQNALDSAGKAGGGVVYLPQGIYKISTGDSYALWIRYSNVVLRGAGKDKTFIYNESYSIRSKSIILIKPQSGGDWYTPEGNTEKLTQDVKTQDTIIAVENGNKYKTGDWIVLTSNVTAGFIADHKMTGLWNTSLPGVAFYRQIKTISGNNIQLDVPVRYYLKTRDNARIYLLNKHLQECGIENLSIGNRENPLSGWGSTDFSVSGTGAYNIHASQLVSFYFTVNSWMKNVSTYKPSVNKENYHICSNGLLLEKSRFITVDSCYFGHPQYEGEGGNGYMYTLRCSECLIKNSVGDNGRHNYDFKSMFSSGNVIYKCTGKNSSLASDFHMHLSMANLFDNHTVDGDLLEAAYRPYGTIQHGQTTTESVFWNTTGIKGMGGSTNIIKSQQWGWGYIIGTQGNATGVSTPGGNNTEPIDFVEGKGKGTTLEPTSLYEDQLHLRLNGYDEPVQSDITTPKKIEVNLYPQPVLEYFTISSTIKPVSVEIFTSKGEKILNFSPETTANRSISTSKFSPGVYLIKVSYKKDKPFISKFIKI